MKKNLFFLLSLCLGLVLFVAAMKRIGLENIFLAVSSISPAKLALILIINFVGILASGWRWKIIIESYYPHKLSFLKILKAKIIGITVNYLTPIVFIGGEPIRAYSIKEEAGVPLDKGVTSIVIDGVIHLSVLFLFFLIGLFFLFSYFIPSKGFLLLIAGFIILSFWLFYIFYSKTLNGSSGEKGFFNFFIDVLGLRKIGAIKKIEQGINNAEQDISYFFKEQRIKLAAAFSLTVFEVSLILLSYWLVIYFLGYNSDIRQILSINSLITLVFLVPIPAALGSFEMSQVFIFPFLGIGAAIGVAFSLIIRVVNVTIMCLGMILLTHFQINTLIKRIKGKEEKLIHKFRKFLNV